MKKANKIISGALSVALVAALSACGGAAPASVDGTTAAGGAETSAETTTTTVVTTTIPTVEIVTTTFANEEEAAINAVADTLPDIELPTNEIKWLAHYDINPNTAGQPKSPVLQLFENKYGGSVKWYETTWDTRFDDLSRYVLGGEGIDFFPGDDEQNYPNGVINGMFQPVDDYINLDDPLWDRTRAAMEIISFGGKHYEFVTNVSATYVVSYSKETIEANGLDDPYELWQAGNWNWDTFKSALSDFVSTENSMFGLDGWDYEKALAVSSGKAIIGTENGRLVSNLKSPEMEQSMNFGYDLYTAGLVKDKSTAGWSIELGLMGEGKELFFIGGIWNYQQSPEVWPTKIAPEDLGIVPVPSPAGVTPATATKVEGFSLLKGASNPEGVAAYVNCALASAVNDELTAIYNRQAKEDYKLTDEILAANVAINQVALDNPVIEFAAGCTPDITELTAYQSGETMGVRAAFHGVEWASTREMISDTIDILVEDVNTQLDSAVNAS